MKKILILSGIILICAISAFAEPKIHVPVKFWDFGNVPQNSTLRHDYWIKNVGTDTLKITRVKPT